VPGPVPEGPAGQPRYQPARRPQGLRGNSDRAKCPLADHHRGQPAINS